MEQDYEDCLVTEHRQNSSFQCLGNFLTCAHQAPNYTLLSYFPLSFSSCTRRRELVLLQVGKVWGLPRTTGICSWCGGAMEELVAQGLERGRRIAQAFL